MNESKKRLGPGSVSLVLVIFALLWACNLGFLNNICLGDMVLRHFGLPAWSNGSNGIHYTVIYSLLFLLPAFYLGDKHRNDLFAKAGKWISAVLLIGIIVISGSMLLFGI